MLFEMNNKILLFQMFILISLFYISMIDLIAFAEITQKLSLKVPLKQNNTMLFMFYYQTLHKIYKLYCHINTFKFCYYIKKFN
jgi:hypothetical protein